jgi:hypothetical protein
MPAIVHTILINGTDVFFSGAILSFGRLYEEAQESRKRVASTSEAIKKTGHQHMKTF